MRILVGLVLTLQALAAPLLPQLSNASPVAWPDAELAREFGFDRAERGEFGSSTVTVFRFQDSTGAYAAMRSIQTPPLTWSGWHAMAVRFGGAIWMQDANYLVKIEGEPPAFAALREALNQLPGRGTDALPPLPSWLPGENQIPGTERFVFGPVALARFQPRIRSLDFAAGTEAVVADYRVDGQVQQLTAIAYLTPQMARKAAAEFEKDRSLWVKRDGPVVAIVFDGPGSPLARKLSGGTSVSYFAQVTSLLHIPKVGPKPLEFLLAFAQLSLLIIGVCLIGGMSWAGFQYWRRSRPGYVETPDFITINLHD
jgi:hypothetical protein